MTAGNTTREATACCGGQAVRLGHKVRDPLCGRAVSSDSPHRLERKGASLRFCSEACRDDFSRAMAGEAVPGIAFACEMHPGGRQDEPGDCAVCGLPLAPVRIAAEGADALPTGGMLGRLRAALGL